MATKKQNNSNAEFFEAVRLLEKEKGIPAEYLIEKIRTAIVLAVRRDFGAKENVLVVMDPVTNEFRVTVQKTVVEELSDPDLELLPEQAVKYKKNAKVGDVVEIELETKQFGRIAAQTAKQDVVQRIREAERGVIFDEFVEKENEVLTAIIQRTEKNGIHVELGKTDGLLPPAEVIAG